MSTIEERVKHVIADQFGINDDQVTLEKSLEDLGGDSLDKVEIVMALEDEFEIDIVDDDGFAITTVQQAVDLVTKMVTPATAP